MNNYITVLIETLRKTSNKKGHITILEVHSQRILKDNINTNHRYRNYIIAVTQAQSMED